MSKTFGRASVAVALLLLAATASPPPARAEEREISIDNFTFTPAELTVKAGTTIKWINRDDIPHTIVDKEKSFRSKALDTDDAYAFTFSQAGTFDYFCGLHPHMVGKIIVTP